MSPVPSFRELVAGEQKFPYTCYKYDTGWSGSHKWTNVQYCTKNEELLGFGIMLKKSSMPPQVFSIQDFCISSTMQNSSCTGTQGLFAPPGYML
jgi:hypothetical protein